MTTMFRTALGILLLVELSCAASTAAGEDERVYRGAKAVHEGDHYAEAVHVDFGDEVYPSRIMDMFHVMPKLKTLVVGGPRYMDRHLQDLAEIDTLRALVLDSTDVTDEAIAKLRKARPELVIYQSQQLAISKIRGLARELAIATRLSNDHPELRKLLGDHYFMEATSVDFGRLPDIETGPFDRILNEQLAPLRMLPTITYLDLSWTRLNDAGMHYLKGLTMVETLQLPLGEVSAEGLAPIRGMANLKVFTGDMSDVKAKHLDGLRKLEFLNIGGPQLTDAGLESLHSLRRLRYVRLNGSNIRGAGLRHLSGLPRLESLYLEYSQLEDLAWIPKIPSLKHLFIGNTEIDDAAMAPLAQCDNLETLWMQNTEIGDAGVAHLAGLPNLRGLSLKDTQVGDVALAHLKKLPELRYLYLTNTRITNSGLKQFQEFSNLEHLFIKGLPLNEEGMKNVKRLTQLKSIRVSIPLRGGNYKARQALYDSLRKALPNCNVN